MIISFVSAKGGVSKSTLAGHLVGWLAMHQAKVVLVDCDTQASCSEWIAEACPEVRTKRFLDADAILNGLPGLSAEAEFIVADCPGNQGEIGRALLMWADLAIIPCKASAFEARALEKNLAYVSQAQAIRKGKPDAVVVLSMVRNGYRLTRDMRSAAEETGVRVAQSTIGLRQVIADAPGQASFVWRMGSRAQSAAEDMDRLFNEIVLPYLGTDSPEATLVERCVINKRKTQLQVSK
ncbi:MAG: ParA family protein [Pirellulaceae bacterium]